MMDLAKEESQKLRDTIHDCEEGLYLCTDFYLSWGKTMGPILTMYTAG